MRSQDEWAEPGAVVVAEGVHRIPVPLPNDGLKAINVYAIVDGDSIALVDSGYSHPAAMAALDDGLATIGAAVTDVSTVLVTHAHYDHFGLAAHIRERSGATVLLGDQETGMLQVALERDRFDRWVEHRRTWLRRHGAATVLREIERDDGGGQFDAVRSGGRWEPPDRTVHDGDLVELETRTLCAHWTPGHTRGHIVFHDERAGLLFAGDHVLPHITPSLGFETFSDGHALEHFLRSLKAVRDLAVERVLPGHGQVFDDLAGRVDELLLHHKVRLESCVEAVSEEGSETAYGVAGRLTWTGQARSFGELDAFNRMLAVTETVTHLELLVQTGKLARAATADDTIAYACA